MLKQKEYEELRAGDISEEKKKKLKDPIRIN